MTATRPKVITAEMLRAAYFTNLEAKRKSNAQEIADFIRLYSDANFKGIYAETDQSMTDGALMFRNHLQEL